MALYIQRERIRLHFTFQFDDPGPNCEEVEDADLDDDEIIAILHRHNSFRDVIAREEKGPGARTPAAYMMQVVMLPQRCCEQSHRVLPSSDFALRCGFDSAGLLIAVVLWGCVEFHSSLNSIITRTSFKGIVLCDTGFTDFLDDRSKI